MQSGLRMRVLGAALAAALAAPAPVRAETDAETLGRIQALEGEIALLKRKLEVKDEEAAAKAPTTAVVGAGKDGFFLQSPDKFFVLKLRGYVQADNRMYQGSYASSSNDTFLLRRIRPIFEGTVGEYVDFRIMPDFASGAALIQDAYMNLKYFPYANLQVGKYKEPFGLERLQSGTALTFIERGLPTDIAGNRDVGVQLWSDIRGGLFTYQLALMNGVTDGGSGDNQGNSGKGMDVIARVFAQPFKELEWTPLQGLGAGFAVSYGHQRGSVASYVTSSQQTFFTYTAGTTQDGDRLRIGPQLNWYWGPFGLLGEWYQSSTKLSHEPTATITEEIRADNNAWQVAASWVLTGENASFRGVVPRENFSPGGGWGAWEVAARFGQLNVDDNVFDEGYASRSTQASQVDEWTVGLNWYLNRWLKFQVNYDRATFDDGAAGGDRKPVGSLFTRFQVQY